MVQTLIALVKKNNDSFTVVIDHWEMNPEYYGMLDLHR